MYPLWLPREVLSSPEIRESESIDLLASALAAVGSIIAVFGILADVEDIEGSETNNSNSAPLENTLSSEQNAFNLTLLGAIIVAFGESLGTYAIVKGIDESIKIEQEEKVKEQELNRTIKEMQMQINILQKDMNSLMRVTTSLQQENLTLQREVHYLNLTGKRK
ncbi:hypothetical protein ACUXCC_005442 [Cytobacillus horneckiae]|uniref:Uncharacterized protein n=1 Tax=Cytobacillus horneckiae TaxID=549687 RepID=A0A2N0ZEE0_9BACI|nr:hypothetical protein [Cytobacillus horneckiae]MBN6889997.1 hypothetical protein [Cytobacillus horneckiae]MCM3176263.1 hypothetical protein [Cytobacillus horneckiae]MEC1159032.1 hypothetical protein [Cytobacillus horneckiae]MED2936780.1 hypothetical protein [Cytobacillus horneckiae]PKG27879.1 hypothetical protein CWS20_16635 [Cytobacillus horneckiae]